MGKSTLIAKFVLDHTLIPNSDLPFVYLDFDRAAVGRVVAQQSDKDA